MKRFLILIIVAFLASGAANASRMNDDINYCEKVIRIAEPSAVICHRAELSDVEINNAKTILRKTLLAYPQFAKTAGMTVSKPKSPIPIVILSRKEINDPAVFPGYDISGSNATARFLPIEKIICVTREALSLNDPNLPHELAHLFNIEAGIYNRARDEQLAYAFEQFYFAR